MTNEKDVAALAQHVARQQAELKEQFLLLNDVYLLKAQYARMRYLAFVKAGFTETQALAMCRTDE